MIRFVLVLFNVAAVTWLIYRLLMVARTSMDPTKKTLIMIGGILLLLAPAGMFIGLYPPSMLYFLFYPAAISLLIYLIREV